MRGGRKDGTSGKGGRGAEDRLEAEGGNDRA